MTLGYEDENAVVYVEVYQRFFFLMLRKLERVTKATGIWICFELAICKSLFFQTPAILVWRKTERTARVVMLVVKVRCNISLLKPVHSACSK